MSSLHPLSGVYHLKIEDDLPQNSAARCNSKNSGHWVKYREAIFLKGKKFNVRSGRFEVILGNPCKRCMQLLSD